jgi:hypothetical protein
MTPDRLRALADAATPGPWLFRPDEEGYPDVRDTQEPHSAIIAQGEGCYLPETEEANLRLIAALGPDAARWMADAADAFDAFRPFLTHPNGGDRFSVLLARFASLGDDAAGGAA